MKIKFQADADLNQTIVKALRRRQPEIDFQSADEAGLRGLSDLDVLARAASAGRILVSHDCNTMPVHFAVFSTTQISPGVFLLAQDLPVNAAMEELLLLWETSEAEEWAGLLQWLPL
jgi:predicted nuclease of predicted toxin-antitoxin system